MAIEGGSTTLSLAIDASQAERGARAFADAIDKITAAGNRAASAVNNLGTQADQSAPQMGRAGDAARKAANDIADLGAAASNLRAPFSAARTAVGGFVTGLAAGVGVQVTNWIASLPAQVIEVGDAYQRLDARLAMATQGMAGATRVHEDLFEASQRLGIGFESNASFFVRIASQSRELGLSYQELLQITETLNGAFKLSGASAGETSAAMMQLGQAFASGRLQGDEFRSMAENAPGVLDRMAGAIGVTRGELMQMASDGELTTSRVAQAVLSMSDSVQSDVGRMGGTVAEAATRVRNAFNELIVDLNKTSEANKGLVSSFDALTAVLGSDALRAGIQGLGTAMAGYFDVLRKGWQVQQSFIKSLSELGAKWAETSKLPSLGEGSMFGPSIEALRKRLTGDRIGAQLRALPSAEEPPAVTGREFDYPSATSQIEAWREYSQRQAAKLPAPTARPRAPGYRMQELELKTGRGGSRASSTETREIRFELDAKPFEVELQELENRSAGALTSTQQRAQDMLRSITEAHAQAFGDQTKIIEMRRDEEIQAVNISALNAEEKAQARVMIEETASRQISQIRQRETDQALSYMEQLEAAHIRQFRGDENRLLEIQRMQQLRQLEQQQGLSPDQREQARSMILDMTQPLTELEKAGVAMVEFGERLTSVEGVAQGVIQGISQIGSTASAAFADAIIAGEDFGDTLSKLGESLARMMIQMTLQMAMQQALGLAVGGIGSMFAPQAGAGAGTQYGATSTTTSFGATLAKGGVINARLPQQVYLQPIYFPLQERPKEFARGGVVETRLEKTIYEKPTYFPMRDPGYKEFAKGVGLLGEAGPEAVLPLTRTSGGELGVKSSGSNQPVIFNMTVQNTSRANVKADERDNESGGKDIMLSIADEVEAITASRASRSGTRLNRSITSIGTLRAR